MPNSISRNFLFQPGNNGDEYSVFLSFATQRPVYCPIENFCGIVGSALQFGLCCPIATASSVLNFLSCRYINCLDSLNNQSLLFSTFGLVGLNMSQNQDDQTQQHHIESQLVMLTEAIKRPINFVDEFLRSPNTFIDDPVTQCFLYENRQIAQESFNSSFGAVNNFNKNFLEFAKKSFDYNQSESEEAKQILLTQLNELKSKLNKDLSKLQESCDDPDLKNKITKNADIFFYCCQYFGEKISNCKEKEYKSFGELMAQKQNIDAHEGLIGPELLTPPEAVLNNKAIALSISPPRSMQPQINNIN